LKFKTLSGSYSPILNIIVFSERSVHLILKTILI